MAITKGSCPSSPGRLPDRPDVGPRLDERLADDVHAVLEGEGQALPVAVGEGGDAEVDPGQVEALAGAQLTTHLHLAADLRTAHLLDQDFDEAVVEEETIAGLHRLGRRAKLTEARVTLPTISSVVRVKGWPLASSMGSVFELADPHLRAGKIGEQRDLAPGGGRRRPEPVDSGRVLLELAVGEVQPGHVQPGPDHGLQHVGCVGGGPDGGDDPGLVGGEHRSRSVEEGLGMGRRLWGQVHSWILFRHVGALHGKCQDLLPLRFAGVGVLAATRMPRLDLLDPG